MRRKSKKCDEQKRNQKEKNELKNTITKHYATLISAKQFLKMNR